jgi:AhpD family alkylhydroperoxidase
MIAIHCHDEVNIMSNAPRLPFHTLQPDAVKSLMGLNNALEKSTLGKKLIDLVYLRVSQINGCAYCNDMHWRDLVSLGEDPRRLNSVLVWRESEFFSERERAALEWTEKMTTLPGGQHPSDADFDALGNQFSDQEIVALTFTIAAINAWNRIGVAFHPSIPALR